MLGADARAATLKRQPNRCRLGCNPTAVERIRHESDIQANILALAWAIFSTKMFKPIEVVPSSLANKARAAWCGCALSTQDDCSLAHGPLEGDFRKQISSKLVNFWLEPSTKMGQRHLGGVPREHEMLKGHLPRAIYHRAY